MSDPEVGVEVDEAEVTTLATGFAVGDLDEGELQRLYDLLRTPGPVGTAAAQVAWRVLGTTIDLRASLSDRFQDDVA